MKSFTFLSYTLSPHSPLHRRAPIQVFPTMSLPIYPTHQLRKRLTNHRIYEHKQVQDISIPVLIHSWAQAAGSHHRLLCVSIAGFFGSSSSCVAVYTAKPKRVLYLSPTPYPLQPCNPLETCAYPCNDNHRRIDKKRATHYARAKPPWRALNKTNEGQQT